MSYKNITIENHEGEKFHPETNVDNIIGIEDLLKEIKDETLDVTNVFHDEPRNKITEDMVPKDFDYGLTLCNQGWASNFPSINKYGVTYTIIGRNTNYAQVFITAEGDIWARRSSDKDSWNGEWYNSKKDIDTRFGATVHMWEGSLDDLTQTGIYTALGAVTDKPTNEFGVVEVVDTNAKFTNDEDNYHKVQRFFVLADPLVSYYRTQRGGRWSSWIKVDLDDKTDRKEVEALVGGIKSNKNNLTEATTTDRAVVIGSSNGSATHYDSGVYNSRDVSTNASVSAIMGCHNSKIEDSDSKYRRQMVMLASNNFTFDPAGANDSKVVGGYDNELSWMLDSRKGKIYARRDIKVGDKSLKDATRSATIVFASTNSRESSRNTADRIIEHDEDASKIITTYLRQHTYGSRIILMEGDYYFNDTLWIDKHGTIIEGQGAGTKIIANSTSSAFSFKLPYMAEEVSNYTVKNLSINGSGSSNGVYAHHDIRVNVENILFTNCRIGVFASGGSEVNTFNCVIEDCKDSGVWFQQASKGIVYGTQIRGSKNNEGIGCIGESEVIIDSCLTEENLIGIKLGANTIVKVVNTKIYNNAQTGLLITTGDSSNNIEVFGCTFKGNYKSPQYLNYAELNIGGSSDAKIENVTVMGNKFIGTGDTHAIYVAGSDNVITNNHLVEDFDYKIIDRSSSGCIIKDNKGA